MDIQDNKTSINKYVWVSLLDAQISLMAPIGNFSVHCGQSHCSIQTNQSTKCERRATQKLYVQKKCEPKCSKGLRGSLEIKRARRRLKVHTWYQKGSPEQKLAPSNFKGSLLGLKIAHSGSLKKSEPCLVYKKNELHAPWLNNYDSAVLSPANMMIIIMK